MIVHRDNFCPEMLALIAVAVFDGASQCYVRYSLADKQRGDGVACVKNKQAGGLQSDKKL